MMATQNPIEQEGTYPLPEAQLDRFLFKLVVGYPTESEYHDILNRTTTSEEIDMKKVSTGPRDQSTAECRTKCSGARTRAGLRHPVGDGDAARQRLCPVPGQRVCLLGSSPRGAQSLLLAGKVRALVAGRFAVSCDDVREIAKSALRHRVMVNFHGISEGITPDRLIEAVLSEVNQPNAPAVA